MIQNWDDLVHLGCFDCHCTTTFNLRCLAQSICMIQLNWDDLVHLGCLIAIAPHFFRITTFNLRFSTSVGRFAGRS